MTDEGSIGRLAIWKHSTAVWDRMRSEADENGMFNGSLRAIFIEFDCVAHRPKVVKALKLMDRIEVISYGVGKQTVVQLNMPDIPLSIHEFEKVLNELQGSKEQRKKTAVWIADQRIQDLTKTVSELLMKVDAIERRLDNKPPLEVPFVSYSQEEDEDDLDDDI